MPIALNICRLDDGDGMVSTLVSSKARYQDSCRLKFNNTKLKRAQKGKVSLFRHWSSNKVHQKIWEVKGKHFLIAFAKDSPLVVKVEKQLLSM